MLLKARNEIKLDVLDSSNQRAQVFEPFESNHVFHKCQIGQHFWMISALHVEMMQKALSLLN